MRKKRGPKALVESVPKGQEGGSKNRTAENCVMCFVFQDRDKGRKLAIPIVTFVLHKRRKISSLIAELFNII